MLISQLIEGTFLEEGLRRFICFVSINGEIHECHVPCSSKLSKHLDLINKKVLLSKNKNSHLRTKYSLFAVEEQGILIFLNLNLLNKIVEEGIKDKQLFSQRDLVTTVEKTIYSYKADVGLLNISTNEKEIIEIKGIISTEKEALHPTINSRRSIEQLIKLKQILLEGHKVYYFLIALSPTIKAIRIDPNHSKYYQLLNDCLKLGMALHGFSLVFISSELRLGKELPVKFNNNEPTYLTTPSFKDHEPSTNLYKASSSLVPFIAED